MTHPLVSAVPGCDTRSLFDVLNVAENVMAPYGTVAVFPAMVEPLTPEAAFEPLLATLLRPEEGGIGWQAEGESALRDAWKRRALLQAYHNDREGIPASTGEAIRRLGKAAADLLNKTIPNYYDNDPRLLVTRTVGGGGSRPAQTGRINTPLSQRVTVSDGALPGEIIGREELRGDVRQAYEDAARLIYCAERIAAQVESYLDNRAEAQRPDPTRLVPAGDSPPPDVTLPEGVTPEIEGTIPPPPTPPTPTTPPDLPGPINPQKGSSVGPPSETTPGGAGEGTTEGTTETPTTKKSGGGGLVLGGIFLAVVGGLALTRRRR